VLADDEMLWTPTADQAGAQTFRIEATDGMHATTQSVSLFVNARPVVHSSGQAASMGAFLLAAGAAGKRYCLPNSRVMIHQPSGGAQGQASDIHIQAQEILKIRARLNECLAHHTGQTVEKIELDTERDNFMNAMESKAYGLIDTVLDKRP